MALKILITGTNKGLGYWLTGNFLEEGHTVFALNRTTSPSFLELQKKYPSRLIVFQADVRSDSQIQSAFNGVAKLTASLDIIVNNAAIYLEPSKDYGPEEIDFDKMQETFAINSMGPLRIMKIFLPLLQKGGRKLLANISSEAGSLTNQFRKSEYAYCMSKAALNMACRILQSRLQSEGIKVLAIHPGWFSSDMGGPEAPVTPDKAAVNVGKLILKEWQLTDPVYMESDGTRIDW